MTLRDDYTGPFDPDLTLADFSRRFLVRLGHEYLLIGHMLDPGRSAARRDGPRRGCLRPLRDRGVDGRQSDLLDPGCSAC